MTEQIAVTYATAALLLDLEVVEFLQAVRNSDLPLPVSLAGHTRWIVQDLRIEASTCETVTPTSLDHTMKSYGIDS
jgi:hypothetical protein